MTDKNVEVIKTTGFLSDLSDTVIDEAEQQGIEPKAAKSIANNVATSIAKMYASDTIYVPRKPLQILRQLKIYREMKEGIPAADVAHSNNVSIQWAYKVYRDMRTRHITKINGGKNDNT